MAEIKIEKKRPVWPWIVVLLLIAGLVYYVFLKDDQVQNGNTVEMENTIATDTIAE
ncbi:hypothetical protein [Flavobacterium seoulense]|uniref:Uncharacterized protein n=1 Tax=Flavobacterium seoulense TaxID=1492738 RepID=A0A066WPC1_9FLAO|nr:hypothetical protein [Flavobacterium seoulense]KDN55882.1 hypothetical protein FEM21_10730 [Flavobacterium seoulense]